MIVNKVSETQKINVKVEHASLIMLENAIGINIAPGANKTNKSQEKGARTFEMLLSSMFLVVLCFF